VARLKNLDDRIEQTLREHSQWTGSAEDLWSRISSQLQREPAKKPWRPKPVWLGAAAATLFLAFMLQTMFNPSAPDVPELTDRPRMQTFSISMVAEEPEVYLGGEDIELALQNYSADTLDPELAPRLLVWKLDDLEEILIDELLIEEEKIRGKHSLWVRSPSEAGLYRLVVEGSFTHDGQRSHVFAEKTILIKGEKSDAELQEN